MTDVRKSAADTSLKGYRNAQLNQCQTIQEVLEWYHSVPFSERPSNYGEKAIRKAGEIATLEGVKLGLEAAHLKAYLYPYQDNPVEGRFVQYNIAALIRSILPTSVIAKGE